MSERPVRDLLNGQLYVLKYELDDICRQLRFSRVEKRHGVTFERAAFPSYPYDKGVNFTEHDIDVAESVKKLFSKYPSDLQHLFYCRYAESRFAPPFTIWNFRHVLVLDVGVLCTNLLATVKEAILGFENGNYIETIAEMPEDLLLLIAMRMLPKLTLHSGSRLRLFLVALDGDF